MDSKSPKKKRKEKKSKSNNKPEKEQKQLNRSNSDAKLPTPAPPAMNEDELLAMASSDPLKVVEYLRAHKKNAQTYITPGEAAKDLLFPMRTGSDIKLNPVEKKEEKSEKKVQIETQSEKRVKVEFDDKKPEKSVKIAENKKETPVVETKKEPEEGAHVFIKQIENHHESIKLTDPQAITQTISTLANSLFKCDLSNPSNFSAFAKETLQLHQTLDDLTKFVSQCVQKCETILSSSNAGEYKVDVEVSSKIRSIASGGSNDISIPPPPPMMGGPPPPPPPGPPPPPSDAKSLSFFKKKFSHSMGSTSFKAIAAGSANAPQEVANPNDAVVNAIKGGIKLRSVVRPSPSADVPATEGPKIEFKLRKAGEVTTSASEGSNDTESSKIEFKLRKTDANSPQKRTPGIGQSKSGNFGVVLRKTGFTFSKDGTNKTTEDITEKSNDNENEEKQEKQEKQESGDSDPESREGNKEDDKEDNKEDNKEENKAENNIESKEDKKEENKEENEPKEETKQEEANKEENKEVESTNSEKKEEKKEEEEKVTEETKIERRNSS